MGRWGGALCYGFVALRKQWDEKSEKFGGYWGERIEKPDLGLLGSVVFGLLLGVFTLVSLFVSDFHVS